MQFTDLVKAVTIGPPPERLQILTGDNPDNPPVVWRTDQGMELSTYGLAIRYTSGSGLQVTTHVGRWNVIDPVVGYSGWVRELPNIASVVVEWGDGMTDRANPPFDQPAVHEYPSPGEYLISAAVEYAFAGYPEHLAVAYPAAKYLFTAEQP